MKKFLTGLILSASLSINAFAQLNEGGLPLGLIKNVQPSYVPTSTYTLPDIQSALKKEREDIAKGMSIPYIVALFTDANVTFPQSGIITNLDDGTQVWKARVVVPSAKALCMYYNKFSLPKGVKYFVSNARNSQILGAYTSNNNSRTGLFSNEAVQGDTLNLEMDIAPGVQVSDIQLEINKLAVYFRGVDYLSYYTQSVDLHLLGDHIDSTLNNSSSVCMINASCPLGANYQTQRQATLESLFVLPEGVGSCSAAMVNNAGNTTADCKKYLLTASHCTYGHYDTSSSDFAQAIFRFNYERASCSDSFSIPTSNSIVGADFVARSVTPIIPQQINGDFILLKITQSIPASWNVKLAGWNNGTTIPTSETAPRKFIGFHHPGGDVKKVSSAQQIQSQGLAVANSHWQMQVTSGLIAEGSSGSALFDGHGLVIGTASLGGPLNVPASCNFTANGDSTVGTGDLVLYSKFSNDWDYGADGNNAHSKLKPWLDPNSTGVSTVAPVTATCGNFTDTSGNSNAPTGVIIRSNNLEDAISVYPNPTSNKVQITINLKEKNDLKVNVMDISGKVLNTVQLKNVSNGSFAVDLSDFANGMYFIQISNEVSIVSKKVVLYR